ncbi:Cys/Met metabolism PLP-dependent enzyme-domain-containing protein [Cubamyces lactineus]|nr:Cys/Met metabolism PLP-dependent enzyme-domain-containing protein [Cubamyces lactineus]
MTSFRACSSSASIPRPRAPKQCSTSNGHVNGANGFHPVKKGFLDGFGTCAIHAGSEASEETGAVIPPISLSTTYKQDAIGKHTAFEYSRSGNPDRNAFETTLATLESSGAYALAFSSGSATTATVLQSLGPDAYIISVNDVYDHVPRLENADDDTIRAAFRPNTKLYWIESPTNPTLRLIDIPRIVSLARAAPSDPLLLIDNTFLSPFCSSPLLQGADIVMHSLTKYVNGHSDVVMGALVLPAHRAALADKLRLLQNAIGTVPRAYDCWLAQRGAKTLHLCMKAHGTNALAVARFLQQSPHVEEPLIGANIILVITTALTKTSVLVHTSRTPSSPIDIVLSSGFLTKCLDSADGFTWVTQAVRAELLQAICNCSPCFDAKTQCCQHHPPALSGVPLPDRGGGHRTQEDRGRPAEVTGDHQDLRYCAMFDARMHVPKLRRLAQRDFPHTPLPALVVSLDHIVLPATYSVETLATYQPRGGRARDAALVERIRRNPDRFKFTLVEMAAPAGQGTPFVLTLATDVFWGEDVDDDGWPAFRLGRPPARAKMCIGYSEGIILAG